MSAVATKARAGQDDDPHAFDERAAIKRDADVAGWTSTQLDSDDGACAATRGWFRAAEANAILRSQLPRLNSGALYGAAALAQIAEEHLAEIAPTTGQPEPTADALEIGLRHLNETLAVVRVVYDNGLDDSCLSGVIALLAVGVDCMNEAISEAMARERAK